MIKVNKIHFDANGGGKYLTGYAECGQKTVRLNSNPNEVTCERCRKTGAYLDALAVWYGRESVKS